MPRSQVVVRDLEEPDIPAVLAMWEELRQHSGRSAALAPPASEARLREMLSGVGIGPVDFRLVVAEIDDEVVGMACYIGRSLGPFVEAPVAQIDYLHVRPSFVRRGVGHALVESAAGYADALGAEHVSVNVFPQLREANRFYAKIGFTPMVVRRVVTVATLRHRLGMGLDAAPQSRRAGLLARRRSVLRGRSGARAGASTPA